MRDVHAMSKQVGNGLTHRHNGMQSSVSTHTSIVPPPSTPSIRDSSSLWSPNPERARAEQFFLLWAVGWVGLMAYIVYTRWFETFTPSHYLAVGLILFLVPSLTPLALPELFLASELPLSRRYTTKANCYIFILAWIANYLWTHYFYAVLHATYTFRAHRLNDVPFALYLITHSYFHLYHVLACMLIRLMRRQRLGVLGVVVAVLLFSYLTAFMETFTIQHFPYYDIPDRWAMYVWGSVFYGLYFVVSYPMFYQLDERANRWSLWRTVVEAMGCAMIITLLLDAWRLGIGKVTDKPAANPPQQSVPFIH